MPTVSIIVNCYNGAEYLSEALDSVAKQTFRDYEVIFWDNQSTDASPEIARGFGASLKYFRGEQFLPLGGARNAAIARADGKYVAFLDCDDVWFPDKLEKQVRLMESDPSTGLVYSDCHVIDGAGRLVRASYFGPEKPFRGFVFDRLLHVNIVPMLTAVVRRDALERVGVFAPDYEIAEEYELWLRISRTYKLDFADEPLGRLRIHGQSTSHRKAMLGYQEKIRIMDHWLGIEKAVASDSRGSMRRMKAGLHLSLASGHARARQYRQAFAECCNLARLFPHSAVVLPLIAGRLGRAIAGR